MAINTVSVTIDLATTPATVSGFGTQLFVSSHKWFSERVRTYNTIADASGIPSDSPEYAAITMHFAQSPILPIKLGRRHAVQTDLTPTGVADGVIYTLTVSVNDGDSVVASYTAGVGDTAADVVTALHADIIANTDVTAHVTATDGTGVLELAEVSASDFFTLTSVSNNFSYDYDDDETMADTLDAVDLEDTDYYAVTHKHNGIATIGTTAGTVEARGKLFLWCSSEQAALTAWDKVTSGVDELADINLNSRRQTVGMFHHLADTIFPEVGVFARFAGKGQQPGTIAWNWKTVSGVIPAQNPALGTPLTATEIGYITSRNANTFEREAVGVIFGPGTVMKGTGDKAGEWIEHVTSKDFLTARITEAYKTKFYNLNKISFSSAGINSQKSTMATVLDRYVETETTPNILDIDRPYELTFPQSKDVSFATKASQTLPVGFKAYLSGTQTGIVVQGTLTFNASV